MAAATLLTLPCDVAGLVAASLPARDLVALGATCRGMDVPWTPAQRLESVLHRLTDETCRDGPQAATRKRLASVRAEHGPPAKSRPSADGTLTKMAVYTPPDGVRVTAKFDLPGRFDGSVRIAHALDVPDEVPCYTLPMRQYEFSAPDGSALVKFGMGVRRRHWGVRAVAFPPQKPGDAAERHAAFVAVLRFAAEVAAYVPEFDWEDVAHVSINARVKGIGKRTSVACRAKRAEVEASLDAVGLQVMDPREVEAMWARESRESLDRIFAHREGDSSCVCNDCLDVRVAELDGLESDSDFDYESDDA